MTNWVTIYDCAQVVKSLGASPVMAHALEEAAEMTGIASALVLNIGTLTPDLVEAMKVAAAAANQRRIPVILDACGAGATRLRDDKALELLHTVHIDILKGNASEIARVAGQNVRTRGVDAAEVQQALAPLATELARQRKLTVVITGPVDVISNSAEVCLVRNGHPLMRQVVGTGCMAASVIGAFAAVEPDHVRAAASALVCYGIAAELAAAKTDAPMAFKLQLLDSLYLLGRSDVETRQDLECQPL